MLSFRRLRIAGSGIELVMAHYLAPLSNGIGDLIVSLPVVQGLIDCGYETYLITRSSIQEQLIDRVEGLSGSVSEEAFSPKNLSKTDVLSLHSETQ